ncbi:glutathione S-transferas-like protein [Aspergillus violaceofuscus CBS 115571]|uniref:Glutathione S-transferas-like protein n=1 Tax=Aspergillus violaceofuscus (strain CBS 115571) TaxID=1450538 RepID=A0A2V5IFJ5_ASPV1|nr:glutathione S-transferas-like protein [Aspergillus violaceofuscus CBS 115571]
MSEFYAPETPSRVKNATGLHLITALTPNGRKAHIYLEELKDAYGLAFTISLIDLDTEEQKKPWFLRLNPNGRIPLLIDNTTTPHPHPVMESSAILLYLYHKVDRAHKFGFADPLLQSQVLQWTAFWAASGQPVQGQWNYFRRREGEGDAAKKRFHDELLRVYHVLDAHLSGRYTASSRAREYLAGPGAGQYTLADINAWAWVRNLRGVGLEEGALARLPALAAWVERVGARGPVQRGALGEGYDEVVHPELVVRT